MRKDTLHTLPPTKIAVLIDGGFFLKRFNALYNKNRCLSAEEIADCMHSMALHMVGNNTLYRIFYYDCMPLGKKFHNPITHKSVDFSKSDEYIFRCKFFDALKRKRKVALRLGTLKDNGNWMLHPEITKEILSGKKKIEDLQEKDVYMEIRQKGIDMKIGVDISSLALAFSEKCTFRNATSLMQKAAAAPHVTRLSAILYITALSTGISKKSASRSLILPRQIVCSVFVEAG